MSAIVFWRSPKRAGLESHYFWSLLGWFEVDVVLFCRFIINTRPWVLLVFKYRRDRWFLAANAECSTGAGGRIYWCPPELGLRNGQLLPCPDSPNCVFSQSTNDTHQIEPIRYSRDRDVARELLAKVLGVVPRTEIVPQTDDYIRAKATSRLMGFVDDIAFYLPETEPVIQVRSAARLGQSDLGVNRRRLEQIRLALQDLGV